MYKIPKGTRDVLPADAYKWHYIENTARSLAARFGFKEVRTPVFEHTELFLRGVGDTTDIVNKEMYTFLDKGDRSLTLKPEGTAGVARCFVENSLDGQYLPQKLYYITPVFRYERPQAGRLREHHQFGVEFFGSAAPEADAEAILLAKSMFDSLGLKNLSLNINSIGCGKCRPIYNKVLKDYLKANENGLCPVCRERMEKNPLRVLDCKDEGCKAIVKDAPKTLDYLCDDCKAHMDGLKRTLDNLGVAYVINPDIVRGLDYYTRTVFEFISTDIGAQGTVCGGGRYDNLIADVGGKQVPAVGFGLGIERLMLTLENLNLMPDNDELLDLYIVCVGDEVKAAAEKLLYDLRQKGISADIDFMARSVKAQLKFADKIGARFVAVIGTDEAENGEVSLKNMADGQSHKVKISNLADYLHR